MRHTMIAGLLALGVVGAAFGADSAAHTATPNTLDPQDRMTTPGLVTSQQAEYRRQRARWQADQVPKGLPKAREPAQARDSHAPEVGIEVRDVDYEIADGIGFHVSSLRGALVPEHTGDPVDFDNPDSYHIHIYTGRVTLSPAQLDALFNRYVLTYAPRALSSVSNDTSNDTLTVHVGARLFAFLPPVGGLPTTLAGPVRVTDDNRLAYTPSRVENFGIPIGGLLSRVGLSLATLTPLDRPGVTLKNNTLFMDPETLFPAPRLVIDRIDDVALSRDGLTLTFSSPAGQPDFEAPPVDTESYIWLQSGDARFFNTVLVNARLLLMNEDSKRLHFHLYHYRAQTAAGRINGLADGTLVARVPNTFDTHDDAPKRTDNAAPKH
ncbi:DUF2993 domain-containing protein [Salinisphaera sp. Q1T1-3]|uniref:DUF2993 domain-containing protein n=1 Tax=Salinisphaera sp. Q1T1-3 TaxID=2321229 RepID=UPI000E74A7BD|nr:DUF2993 domain-containing protein [Salinisphaera sp. Q1T1-3]RJS94392.1 DUF2993 domain-containing protein [Salinisphaera sp. Q1T1-3]